MVQNRRTWLPTMQQRFARPLGRNLFLVFVWSSVSATALGWWKPPMVRFADDEKTPAAADESPKEQPKAVPETPRKQEKEPAAFEGLPDVNPSSLRGVTPGLTSLAELKDAWGKSQKTSQENGIDRLSYRIKPFAHVEVELVEGIVSAIQIELAAKADPASITKELDLGGFRSFDIPDTYGVLVGRVFPERGVTYTFVVSADDEPPLVSHISLEPTTAEFFVLRVIYDFSHSYQNNLADLDFAQQLDPSDARAYWLKAKIMHAVGQKSQSLTNAREAVRLQPQNAAYQLTLGATLIANAEEAEAQHVLQTIVEQADVSDDLLAHAHILLGDIAAKGSQPNYQSSVQHYTEAIRLANNIKDSEITAVRRNGQMILIQANLGAAYAIAVGNWTGKSEMTPRWIHQAKRTALDIVENDQGDIAYLSFLVLEKSLEAYAAANGEFDPTKESAALVREGERIVEAAKDPLYKKELQWRFGLALFHTVEAHHIRGQHEKVKAIGYKALKLLVEASGTRDAGARHNYLFGRLYFYVGAAEAIGGKDHQAALRWYARAIEFLEQAPPPASFRYRERHGERFVSMGLTYWEAGKREKGVVLTLAGLELVQQAVDQGEVNRKILAVPLDNLAKMYESLGQSKEAQDYARRAKNIATAAKTPTRR